MGYNRAFIADKKTKTATIPIGHADGISRKLGNGIGHVLINGQKATIIGNVCMDMIIVDITTIDCAEVDEVIVFNSQEMIQEIAEELFDQWSNNNLEQGEDYAENMFMQYASDELKQQYNEYYGYIEGDEFLL